MIGNRLVEQRSAGTKHINRDVEEGLIIHRGVIQAKQSNVYTHLLFQVIYGLFG